VVAILTKSYMAGFLIIWVETMLENQLVLAEFVENGIRRTKFEKFRFRQIRPM